MGQWSSGYDTIRFAEFFDEFFGEKFKNIFYGLSKTFFFLFLQPVVIN